MTDPLSPDVPVLACVPSAPITPGVRASDMLERSGQRIMWRRASTDGMVLGIELFGELTDEVNRSWRARFEEVFAEYADAGELPTVVVLNVLDAQSASSLGVRMQTALLARKILTQIKMGYVLTGGKPKMHIVAKAAQRVAGMPNLVILNEGESLSDNIKWAVP